MSSAVEHALTELCRTIRVFWLVAHGPELPCPSEYQRLVGIGTFGSGEHSSTSNSGVIHGSCTVVIEYGGTLIANDEP